MITRSVFDVISVDYSPVARATSELAAVIPVQAGDIILNAYFIPIVLSTTGNTVTLGHTGDVARFTASYDTSGGTAGTPQAGQVAAFPRVILVAENLNVDYVAVGGGGTATPKVRFKVAILRSGRL